MKFVVLYEPQHSYIIQDLNKMILHSVVATLPISWSTLPVSTNNIPPDVCNQIKNVEFDVILLAIECNFFEENILLSLRAANIQNPVVSIRSYALQKKLPFMYHELFLKDRVDVIQDGGGITSHI